jgi:hypothetical protein
MVSAGDLILSLTTAYFLIKTKQGVLPQTVGLISALVRLTFQTAAPAALWYPDAYFFSLQPIDGTPLQRHVQPHILAVQARWSRLDIHYVQHGTAQTLRDIHDVDTQCPPHHALGAQHKARAEHQQRRDFRGAFERTAPSDCEFSGTRRIPRVYISYFTPQDSGDVELGPIQVLTQTETHIVSRSVAADFIVPKISEMGVIGP